MSGVYNFIGGTFVSVGISLVCPNLTSTEFKKVRKMVESSGLKLNVFTVPKCPLNPVVLNMPGRMLDLRNYKM